MKIILIIVILIVVVVVVFAFLKKKITVGSETRVQVSDIPAIFEKLKTVGTDGSFAVFIFRPPESASAGEAINVQFSIEGGRIGFDWVLLGPLNIEDKEKFVQLAGKLGFTVIDREMNNVKYLRVEDGDLPRLCKATICDLYSVPSDAEIGLIPAGFQWP